MDRNDAEGGGEGGGEGGEREGEREGEMERERGIYIIFVFIRDTRQTARINIDMHVKLT